jgi:hypothetical protein
MFGCLRSLRPGLFGPLRIWTNALWVTAKFVLGVAHHVRGRLEATDVSRTRPQSAQLKQGRNFTGLQHQAE